MPAISIPASSNSIVNLLKVLATGIAISTSKADLLAVSKAAEAISIEMENWQIGVKNRGNVKVSMNENKASKKIAQKSAAKKMSNSSVTQEVLENFDEKKYSCSDCGKHFGRKDHLNRHTLTHSDVVYPCDICGSSFKRKDGLKHHLSKVHDTELNEEDDPLQSVKVKEEITGEESLSEGDCEPPREFDDVDEFSEKSEKQQVAEFDAPETIEEKGGMIQDDNDSLTYSTESKYKCNQCEKVFKNPQHLRRHEAVHSGIKFSCNVCESSFSRKDKLTAHMRKKHSQVDYDEGMTSKNENEQISVDSEVKEPVSNDNDALMDSN